MWRAINKILALAVGGLGAFAVFNRSAVGQRAMVAASTTAETVGEAVGVMDITSQAEKNIKAFLRTIRMAEGTAGIDGYRMLFGGSLFLSYADHPGVRTYEKYDGQFIKNGKIDFTTAAGAYQITGTTWAALQARLGLTDFAPGSQDAAAMELIREKGALQDVKFGRFTVAVEKVRPVWASLPGAGYGQPEKKMTELVAAYKSAGGVIA